VGTTEELLERKNTDPEVRVPFPALPDCLRSSGSGTGSTQPREYNWLPLWSSGHRSWLQIQILWGAVGLERGPLSLVSTIVELLGKKNCGSGLGSREYGRRDPSRWPRGTLYPRKLALTSLASGGRSVGIGRSWAQATQLGMDCWVANNGRITPGHIEQPQQRTARMHEEICRSRVHYIGFCVQFNNISVKCLCHHIVIEPCYTQLYCSDTFSVATDIRTRRRCSPEDGNIRRQTAGVPRQEKVNSS
jgi:hypothetical protein